MSERLRVAVAGCHRMLNRQPGSHNWGVAFDAVPDTQVVAVFDAGAETREAFVSCWSTPEAPITAYGDYTRMLREVRPDLLCVATRQTMHTDQIEQAVAAGVRGILCDKPLATSLAEMDRILAACRQSRPGTGRQSRPGTGRQSRPGTGSQARVPLAFGLDRRWTTRYRWARRLVADGAVGEVRGVMAYALQNLINHGCHWYDVALSLAGDAEPVWVSGLVDDVSHEPEGSTRRLDPSGRAQVGLAGGATIYATPDGRPGLAFEVLGDKGRLLLLNDARDAWLWQTAEGTLSLAGSAGSALRPVPLAVPETPAGWEAGPAAVADLVTAVRDGGSTACDLEQARRATEIGFAVHASSAQGGRRLAMDQVDRTLRIPSLPWGNE